MSKQGKLASLGLGIVCGLSLLVLNPHSPLRAETAYVYVDSLQGDDVKGDGKTPGTAYATISRAQADLPLIAAHQYVIQLADGTYYINSTIVGGMFCPTCGMTIQGNPQDRSAVAIRNTGDVFSAFDFWSGGFQYLQNLTIEGFRQGVVSEGLAFVTLRDVVIKDCDVAGIAVNDGSLLLLGRVDIIMMNSGTGVNLWPRGFLTFEEGPVVLNIQNADVGIRVQHADVELVSGSGAHLNPNPVNFNSVTTTVIGVNGSRVWINNASFGGTSPVVKCEDGSFVNLNGNQYKCTSATPEVATTTKSAQGFRQ